MPGELILLAGVYWAGGRYLLRFVMTTVIEPRLDARYPLSVPRGSAR